ncbi:MAG TPA: trypsin-like peptidase domain-containing protein [Solirubrobacteraceae bacterium]|nr:trypsin-like peptidase domain-containing protein [Solirubrobacteraceae bacterium]
MTRPTRLLPVLAAALVGAAIAVIATSGGSTHSVTTTVVQPTSAATLPSSMTSNQGLSVNQIYRQDGPGVVDITVTATTSSGGFFGGTQQTQGEGAGVVYDKKGDILTDEHVVDNATSVTVTFENGYKVGAKVVGTDPSTDVAVIHVDAPASQLHPIAMADSSNAQVGDPVVAIGSPFSLPETVTAGIVSAVGRSITAPNGFQILGAIQTDAAINPGNSGGPLLDGDGRVLGLSDQIETNNTTPTGQGSSSGVGFAIASNMVVHIANDILAGHPVKHPYVGVDLNGGSTGGAEISQVEPGSPASNAGLQQGDVVTAIDGKKMTSTQQFIETVDNYSPGQVVTLTVKRGSGSQSIKLTLGTRPNAAPSGG